MKQNVRNALLIAGGLVLVGAGIFLVTAIPNPQGLLLALPYVGIGVGCGTFGYGAGDAISMRALKNNPELQKELEIAQTDERNVAIADRAKAKAFDVMLYIFGALMLSFSLMNIELAAILLLVFAYLLVVGLSVYYRVKLEKEM